LFNGSESKGIETENNEDIILSSRVISSNSNSNIDSVNQAVEENEQLGTTSQATSRHFEILKSDSAHSIKSNKHKSKEQEDLYENSGQIELKRVDGHVTLLNECYEQDNLDDEREYSNFDNEWSVENDAQQNLDVINEEEERGNSSRQSNPQTLEIVNEVVNSDSISGSIKMTSHNSSHISSDSISPSKVTLNKVPLPNNTSKLNQLLNISQPSQTQYKTYKHDNLKDGHKVPKKNFFLDWVYAFHLPQNSKLAFSHDVKIILNFSFSFFLPFFFLI